MLIVDIPGGTGRLDHRVLILGGSRVRNSYEALAARSEAGLVYAAPPLSQTASEALQAFDYFRGARHIPPSCVPLVFGSDTFPDRGLNARNAIDTSDTIIVEDCDRALVRFRDITFNTNYFSLAFVKKLGRPIIDWYRAINTGTFASEELVEKTLELLRLANKPAGPEIAEILRHTRFVKETALQRRRDLEAIVGDRTR